MKGRLLLAACGCVALFGGLLLAGLLPHLRREAELRAAVEARGGPPVVSVVKPRRAPREDQVPLPGTIEAMEETTIYARVNGYLKGWLVDIGDRVEAGALLAEIETPELDQEEKQAEAVVAQLRAKLLTTEAGVHLAQSTNARYRAAAEQGGISAQQLEESQAAVETAQAAVEAARQDIAAGEANLRRLAELTSFAAVHAPFAGTITRRSIENGGLVTAGNGTSQALFRLARVDPVRVFVHVPQMYAPAVAAGSPAELVVREYPGRAFHGEVTRSAGALDPSSRTLLTQIEVANGDRALLPGMFVKAKLSLPRGGAAFLIPASSLSVHAEGTQVAIVGPDGRAHFRKVEIVTDSGSEIAVEGLSGEERIVVHPSERLSEGGAVKVEDRSPPPAGAEAEKSERRPGA